jgi:dipeptide transport system substrate-binding protein
MRLLVKAAALAIFVSVFASAASAKLLTFCSEADPEGFDPAAFTTGATLDASSQAIYNRLVEFAPGSADLVPGLAERWDVSDDGLTYTFHLRPNVGFHAIPDFAPTRPLNAGDVVFSLARQIDPEYRYNGYLGGHWPWASALALETKIASIEAIDDLTVEIELAEPDSGFPALLAMDFASILSREYADALLASETPGRLNEAPVGTGPFVFSGYAPGIRIGYRANPAYWGGAPAVDTLIFSIVPDPAARLRKLRAGECQVMASPDPATLSEAAADESLEIVEADRLDLAYLAVNTRQAPFGDVRIRRAIGMAIDKQAIIDIAYSGSGVAADTILAPSMPGYDSAAAVPAFDAEAARDLLAAAGASNLKLNILTANLSRPYNPEPRTTADMIAADLESIGVDATVIAPEMLGDFLRGASDEERNGAVLIGWTNDTGDPVDFLATLLSCDAVGASNRAQWCYAPFDELLAAARETSGVAERSAILSEAQALLALHQPIVPLAHSVVSVAVSVGVSGFAASPFGRHNFERVDISE